MKMLKRLLCISAFLIVISNAHGQGFLKKMKEKADKAIDQTINGNKSSNQGNNGTSGSSNTGGASNKTGGGLISTPPDVNENLNAAEKAFDSKSYSDARYSVQQAMLGVELQIGQQILKGLPDDISGLKKDTTKDQVTSTGWGWAGLTIQREYRQNDMEFKVAIANNAVWMQAINAYFTNAGYAQTNGGEQKWKQTRVKGYKAIIEWDASSGYKLSVPIGQTSLIIMEGVNFKSEQDMMNAAEKIDIDKIKSTLGEK
jgi:hypothetical protein